jgi:4-amino-4-deoxy-L-arabinose transferase-like glycosyltransferase
VDRDMRKYYEIILLIVLTSAYFAWLAFPLVLSASENLRIVSVFIYDEAWHLELIKKAIENRTFRLHFFGYGHLFFNITIVPLMLLSFFCQITEQQIIVMLRLVSTFFAVGTILITFILAQRYFGRFSAWLSALILAIVPLHFIKLSLISHPDTAQLFFLVLGIYFCCRMIEEVSWKWLFFASGSAGLAFACKYSGIFLLPIIGLIIVFQSGEEKKWQSIIKKAIITSLVFGLAFFITSPYSFARLNFLRGMYRESIRTAFGHCAYGHCFGDSSSGLTWFNVLLSRELLDIIVLSLVAVRLITIIYGLFKKGHIKKILNPENIIWIWVVFYLTFLIFRVRLEHPHYMLPIIPFVIILSTLSISDVFTYLRHKYPAKIVAVFGILIISVFVGYEIHKSFQKISTFRQETITRAQTSTAVKAGRWLLEEDYSRSTRILSDRYSYVPNEFLDAHYTWGGTVELIIELEPDIVIVNNKISNHFSDIDQADKYFKGEELFMKRYQYYSSLRNEKLHYSLARDFGDVQIYSRK